MLYAGAGYLSSDSGRRSPGLRVAALLGTAGAAYGCSARCCDRNRALAANGAGTLETGWLAIGTILGAACWPGWDLGLGGMGGNGGTGETGGDGPEWAGRAGGRGAFGLTRRRVADDARGPRRACADRDGSRALAHRVWRARPDPRAVRAGALRVFCAAGRCRLQRPASWPTCRRGLAPYAGLLVDARLSSGSLRRRPGSGSVARLVPQAMFAGRCRCSPRRQHGRDRASAGTDGSRVRRALLGGSVAAAACCALFAGPNPASSCTVRRSREASSALVWVGPGARPALEQLWAGRYSSTQRAGRAAVVRWSTIGLIVQAALES